MVAFRAGSAIISKAVLFTPPGLEFGLLQNPSYKSRTGWTEAAWRAKGLLEGARVFAKQAPGRACPPEPSPRAEAATLLLS